MCTQLIPFKTIWPYFCIVYPVDSFQEHFTQFHHCIPYWLFQDQMTWFLHCVPNWLLSRPFDPILSLCTLLTPFKTIWTNFIIVDQIDSFQDHLTSFYHCVPNWLFSRPFDLIFVLCTQLTPFKTISPNFIIVYLLTPFKTIWPDFCIVYPIDFFQDHLTQFYHCVPYWLLSTLSELILL